MPLLLPFTGLLLMQATVAEPAMAERIHRIFEIALSSDDPRREESAAAELQGIFAARGIPAIREVGDRASYQFVFAACSQSDVRFAQQVLEKARAGVARNEIPADAATYCEAHLRLEAVKLEAKTRPPLNSALRDRIERLYAADQAVRQKEGFDAANMTKTDRQLAAELRTIFSKYGAPTYRLTGPDAATHFVVMIQHQSPEFRRQVLPRLKENVDKGQADPGAYAMMLDRSLSDSGKRQMYGENLTCDHAHPKLHTGPIEDETRVNERRAAIGLMRLELYAALVVRMSPDMCPAGPESKEAAHQGA